ncbi:MAG TPA: ABC transporter permease subunit [Pseudonocardiaceae bacterium]|nr:ABC transporter permease subunit [Pseudonocardiaceae bacterium]
MTGSVAAQQETRARVGAPDLLWPAWRQHRWTIVSGAVLVAALGGYMLWNTAAIIPGAVPRCGGGCPADVLSATAFGPFADWLKVAGIQLWLAAGFGGLVAVFWAAPLVAREFEQGTHVLAWSQDVSARRWLVGKVVVLAVAAVGFAAALGAVAGGMVDRLSAADSVTYTAFDGVSFEASAPLQASFALFGFALGLAASVLLRRTVPAMGVTLAVFAGVRAAVSLLRHNYLPPTHQFVPLSAADIFTVNGLVLNEDLVNAAGQSINYTINCPAGLDASIANMNTCLRHNGVAGDLFRYQPADRLPTFRLIESGIFVVLAVALFAVTWLWLRRSTVRGAR